MSCIKEFISKKPFIVANCNKNIGWAILENNIYDRKAFEHLQENQDTYKQLNENPIDQTIKDIN